MYEVRRALVNGTRSGGASVLIFLEFSVLFLAFHHMLWAFTAISHRLKKYACKLFQANSIKGDAKSRALGMKRCVVAVLFHVKECKRELLFLTLCLQ